MGALAKISGIVNVEDLEAIAIEQFGRRGELNAKAIELGANGVKKLD
jgi:Pyruvate/2-oxoacid:ferredoxin oxidoreductase gamma subunit